MSEIVYVDKIVTVWYWKRRCLPKIQRMKEKDIQTPESHLEAGKHVFETEKFQIPSVIDQLRSGFLRLLTKKEKL